MAESQLNDWTLMFFFAGDNSLSPLIVSQLKAIKDAGFQEHTEVLVHFDSNERGVPTRVYNVNRTRKLNSDRRTMIGDGRDPFVRNMFEDNVDPQTIVAAPTAGPASIAISQALQQPDASTAKDALKNFIGFCRENHRAKHYILFLVGHGMVVGNDSFLPDEQPISAITLLELDEILRDFSRQAQAEGGALELLALHSCSMSAIEVAYQLKGAANYMMASEGVSFVGSWPYRQLLKKSFNTINGAREAAPQHPQVDVPELMEKLYYLSLHNATDFMLAGYSLDLALCRLDPGAILELKPALQTLVGKLNEGLRLSQRFADLKTERANYDPQAEHVKEMILLAHWKAQSYWGENYTDLYDFCQCLGTLCANSKIELEQDIATACAGVMQSIAAVVVQSQHFGSRYQYSHGLSIYFPWSEPADDDPVQNSAAQAQCAPPAPEADPKAPEDATQRILSNYRNYAFTAEFEQDAPDSSWLSFLELYFEVTKRSSRDEEDGRGEGFLTSNLIPEVFDPFGQLSGKPTGAFSGKPTGTSGLECDCPSIKNYPTEQVEVQGKPRVIKKPSISKGAFRAIE